MFRLPIGLIVLCSFFTACGNNDEKKEQQSNETSKPVTGLKAFFPKASLPYQLSDTALAATKELKEQAYDFSTFISDSLRLRLFGKNAEPRFTPLAQLAREGKETFYLVMASAAKTKAAFLLVYDNRDAFVTSTPFLLPDNDPNTSQTSTIDKTFTITKNTVQRDEAGTIGEGREVIAYEPSTKSFSVIMMDALADNPSVLVNPIDTFPKTNKLAGDYLLNKKNIVSVRDGRYPNQLLVFIHTENKAGDCIGQMRGEFIMTSSTTAAYRQGGDPCVLNLTFKDNSVSINEERGCGNYRGLDCLFTGSFARKKATSAKPPSKKPKTK